MLFRRYIIDAEILAGHLLEKGETGKDDQDALIAQQVDCDDNILVPTKAAESFVDTLKAIIELILALLIIQT